MITKQFIEMVACTAMGVSKAFTKYDGSKTTAQVPLGNNVLFFANGLKYPKSSVPTGTGTYVLFGDGTTQPNEEDYGLSGNIITGIACSYKFTAATADNNYTASAVYTITNNKENEVTISEVGLFGWVNGTNGYGPILYDRALLDTPVTIPAGGVGQVTYAISAASTIT